MVSAPDLRRLRRSHRLCRPRRKRTPCVYIPAPGQRIVSIKALHRQHATRKSEWPTVCPPRRCPKTARHPQTGMATFKRAARPKRQTSQPIRKLNCPHRLCRPRRQRTPCVYIPAPGQRIVNLKALHRQHAARKSEWPTVCPPRRCPKTERRPQMGMAAFDAARPKRQTSQPIRKLNCPCRVSRQRTPCVYIPASGQRIVNIKALHRQHAARKREWPTVCPPRRCPKTARHRKSE